MLAVDYKYIKYRAVRIINSYYMQQIVSSLMQKKLLRICYVDMLPDFILQKDEVYKILLENWDLRVDNEHPDLLIYSSNGYEHMRYHKPTMLFVTGENIFPNFNHCDYSLSFVRDDFKNKNFYSPLTDCTMVMPMPDEQLALSRSFACFVASQDTVGRGAALRRDFTHYLMTQYKHVDCPGKILHNVDTEALPKRCDTQWRKGKIDLLSNYKFNIAFENSNTDGYITEKLTDPFQACTVPIYWGGAGNIAPFPREAMIYANDYESFDALIARIRQIDENDDLYLSMLHANPLYNSGFIERFRENQLARKRFIEHVAEEAYRKSTVGELQKVCRCNEKFSIGYKMSLASKYCPYCRTDKEDWKKFSHLYVFRPNKIRMRCPIAAVSQFNNDI